MSEVAYLKLVGTEEFGYEFAQLISVNFRCVAQFVGKWAKQEAQAWAAKHNVEIKSEAEVKSFNYDFQSAGRF